MKLVVDPKKIRANEQPCGGCQGSSSDKMD